MQELEIIPFHLQSHQPLIAPLTELLHAAYKPLAENGMRYLATHQPSETTYERLLEGESYLCFWARELIGTVTLKTTRPRSKCAWYRQPGNFHFSQFAIHPEYQKRGIGSKMMNLVEIRARQLGAAELALDTSEHAAHLIEMYEKRGYRLVDHVSWEATNYRSVILSKKL